LFLNIARRTNSTEDWIKPGAGHSEWRVVRLFKFGKAPGGGHLDAVDRWDFKPAHNHLGSKVPVFCTLRSADVAKGAFFQLGQGSSRPIRISRVGEKIVAVNSPRPFLASQVLGGAALCPENRAGGEFLNPHFCNAA
jgi:hypothetical protein